MANLIKIREALLSDGKITSDEVDKIKQQIVTDGKLDARDARLLVELMKEADEVCPEFDKLFFPLLREIMLDDGQVGLDEQFVILQLLYSDGEVRESERSFLMELYRAADELTPEFKALCEIALNCSRMEWSVEA